MEKIYPIEGINICILKKQIYSEFNKFFLRYDDMNIQLFIEYISHIIKFYETASSNIYLTSINKLKDFLNMFNSELNNYDFTIITLKPLIGEINNVDILFNLLSFFVGKNNARLFVHNTL